MLYLTSWAALLMALSAFIPAVVAAYISFLSYRESQYNSRQLASTQTQLVVAQEGVDKVHEIVNSQKTAMVAEIAYLKDRVDSLHSRLVEKTVELDAVAIVKP